MDDFDSVDEIALPSAAADVVDQDQLRGRLKRNESNKLDTTGAWMDEERLRLTAYEYLCHLEEAKTWMEQCTGETLPASVDLEDMLTNGVALAKLAKFFDKGPKVQRRRIYDADLLIFNESGLRFKHTDNINMWFRAMEDIGLPEVFIPTTIDLYEKKNMPKVIYCIHALSHYLYKKGMSTRIQDLVNKVEFTEEEISTMQAALKQYGVSMPQFGTIAGVMARELSDTDAEMHAAIIAINEAVLKADIDDTLATLKIPAAQLENIVDEEKDAYQRKLLRELLLKRKGASEQPDKGDSQDDMYSYMLTQKEIQAGLDWRNFCKAIQEINAAVRHGDALETTARLQDPMARVRNVVTHSGQAYQDGLCEAQHAKLERARPARSPVSEGEFEGKAIPPREALLPEDLTFREIQETVARVNRDEAKKAYMRDHEAKIASLQAVARGHLDRLAYRQVCAARLRLAEVEWAEKQRQAELEAERREAERARLAAMLEEERQRELAAQRALAMDCAAVKIQGWYRGQAQRWEAERRDRELRGKVESVQKLQRWIRANLKRRHYDMLTKSKAPSVGSIRGFVDLLHANEADMAGDLELQQLTSLVEQHIRTNQQLEQELNVMDLKIGLLVKNRISLEEAVAQSKKLTKRQKAARRRTTPSPIQFTTKEGRERLASYQTLFYLLQTQPDYLAKLIFLLPPTSTTKFIENVVLAIFHYAQNDREEYHLLRLFKCAIAEEVDKVDDVGEFTKGNQLVVRMVVYYNRGVRETQFLRELFGPLVAEVLQTNTSVNANPIDIYKQWISQTEVDAGKPSALPYDVTVAEALKHDIVAKAFQERLENIVAIARKFLATICGSVDKLPYGIRAIAMDMRTLLAAKFTDASVDDIAKAVGHLVFFRYMNPAIVSPDVFDVVNTSHTVLISQEQRRHLGEISKILQLIASNKRFDEDEAPHLASLNEFIAESYLQMKDFLLQASTTVAPEEHFNIDEYSDLKMLNKPVIYISAKEVFKTHALLRAHQDELCPAPDDPLRQVLEDLGDVSEQVKSLMGDGPSRRLSIHSSSSSSVSDQWVEGEVCLTLTPSVRLPGEDELRTRAMFVKTKGLVVQVISCQPGHGLLEILSTPSTPEQEEAHAANARALKAIHNKLVSEDMGPRQQADSIVQMVEQSVLSLEEIKTIILEDCVALEAAGLVTRESGYQELLNAIAKDIQNVSARQQQRKKEIDRLRTTLGSLQAKRGYYDGQIQDYQTYVKTCMEKMAAGHNRKGGIRGMFGRVQGRAHPQVRPGSHKVSAKRLYREGVLLEIAGVAPAMFTAIQFVVSSAEPGVFHIEGFVAGRKEDEMELQLSDLLQLQYNGIKVHSIPPLKINVNLMVHFLNTRFYRQ